MSTTQSSSVCRFYGTKAGCRAGPSCPYKHETRPPRETQLPARRYQAPVVPQSKIVSRPVAKAEQENPRDFQVGQIRRRFAPEEREAQDGTSFTFKLAPTDPDFPYDIDALLCVLTIPHDYPVSSRPRLRITNPDLQRGFQINVENGFDGIVAASPTATLLGLMNRLDKALVDIFARPMADTIKLYRPAKANQPEQDATKALNRTAEPASHSSHPRRPQSLVYSGVERASAEAKREADIRQLKARLGKSPGFAASSDGISFSLPTTIFRTATTPHSIRQASSLTLIVPAMYNLVPARITFGGEQTGDVRNVMAAFEARGRLHRDAALLAQVNHLSLNLTAMSQVVAEPRSEQKASTAAVEVATGLAQPQTTSAIIKPDAQGFDAKPHIQVIPRPPEWDIVQTGSGDDSDSSEYTADDDSDEADAEDDQSATNTPGTGTSTSLAEKGIMLSLPSLELYGIELLELQVLNITVKCDRCKDSSDIERIRNNTSGDHAGLKEQACKKCGATLAVGFRMDLIHANSSRAGFLDLSACSVVDLLPCTFVPTCASCSTTHTSPPCVSVRGDTCLTVCRTCHAKLSFRINEVRLLRTATNAASLPLRPNRRAAARNEHLGITAGTELPRRGRCAHYAKSYRWFRFGCCGKVYPCDRCHDAADKSHPHEFANRMLCGWCSREQNYRPEDCGMCHASLVGRKGTGFWEGGKGTRDRARMSRKDPRKFKRRGGTKVGGGGS